MTLADRARPWARWLVPLACVLPYLGFWLYGLFDLDEGFYAAVVSEMGRRGEWITPFYNGQPWFEKPILAYWITIPSVSLFGEGVGPRLPAVLATLATTWVLARWVRRWFGEIESWLVALVYSGCLLVAGVGRMMMTDPPLVLFLVLALTCFFDSCARPEGRPSLRLLAALFVGVGVLAKGPVAAVLFLGILAGFSWVAPGWRRRIWAGSATGGWGSALWGSGGWLLGLTVALATLSLWYVPCYLANGQQFIDEFLIKQNIGRFSGGDRAHGVPWWAHPFYYPAILLVALAPGWAAGRGPFRLPEGPETRVMAWKFALVSALVPLLFFTLSGTKLPHYILPSVPGLAVVLGVAAARDHSRSLSRLRGLAAWSVVLLALLQSVFTWDWRNRMEEVQTLAVQARQRQEPLVLFRIGGGRREPGIGLRLQDTTHPSVLFYYGRDLLMTDEVGDLQRQTGPFLVLTRQGAEGDPDFRKLGKIELLGGDNYRLLRIEP
ncbi:MAG: glycosyltransferase family 39 protein [Fimbriimonadaceae bacterium]|nr:glycosyltransferase family 39 protein [Fimbriimonadaceae bacterium]QYK58527.1 MAG: glycosyltransferase family 39 protein [Fimbriimonadaceae bacterium]